MALYIFFPFLLGIFSSHLNLVYSADKLPVVIVTWAFPEATAEAWNTVTGGGNAVDSVEAGCNICELDPSLCRYSVGFGNIIDDTGEPTLDSMIMDGVTHDVGAVGCLRRVKKAISVARLVMEHTKHTLLVGDSATDFAQQFGNEPNETLKNNRTRDNFEKWTDQSCQPNFWENVTPDPTTSCGPFSPSQPESRKMPAVLDKDDHDTIGMVVVDGESNIACGTSTNGLSYKITGRVGDSPIVGAGCYVDNDVGGAAATGNGDIMIRLLPSYQAVENMRRGMTPSEATAEALSRIAYKYNDFVGALIAANKEGEYGAACYGYSTVSVTYRNSTSETSIVEVIQCTVKAEKPSVGVGSVVQPNHLVWFLLLPMVIFL